MVLAGIMCASCDDDTELYKDPVTCLSNDCIKRSPLPIEPNIVGEQFEIVYAMAIPQDLGKLTEAKVEASIPGEFGTAFDPQSYHTTATGADEGIMLCSPSVTKGSITTAKFIVDTCAASLRFYYVIPESARGKEVSFRFSCTASNGQTAYYDMGPYKISNMDMSWNLVVNSSNSYISFHNEGEAIHVYSNSEIESDPSLLDKVDVVFHFSDKSDLQNCLFNAGAPADLLDGDSMPEGFANKTKMIKKYAIRDRQLANLQYSEIVDDLDLKEMTFGISAVDYLLKMQAFYGFFYETADGKYRGYVFVNQSTSGSLTLSAKRLAMK